MQWMGALLILLAFTWTGFEFARKLSARPRQIRQLKVALQTLESEMLFGHTPLSEACARISTQIPPPVSYLFQQFSDRLKRGEMSADMAWRESIKETWAITELRGKEKEVLQQFGATLGQQDRVQQQKQIRLALDHLDREETEAKEYQKKYESMSKSLGFLTGMLVIVLMI